MKTKAGPTGIANAPARRKARAAASSLTVEDVVQYGQGKGSRMDLTVVFENRRLRLTALPAKQVLSYGRIEKEAFERGFLLPHFRHANGVWRKVLAPAMKTARMEPLLEGEEISEAIAAELRDLLARCRRASTDAEMAAGRGIEREAHLLMSPKFLVQEVQRRLVDEVPSRATIAGVAKSALGMRESRPRFPRARLRAWAFPLSAIKAEGASDGEDAPAEVGASASGGGQAPESVSRIRWIQSMDRGSGARSAESTVGYEVDPVDRASGNTPRSVHGPDRSKEG